MERECCLSMLITLVGGTTLLACGWWPVAHSQSSSACTLEQITWARIWQPVVPALMAAVALCGWALVEPDPVPEKVPWSLMLMAIPFALLMARAAIRSGRAVMADQGDPATATVGLLRPWIVFSPHLAKRLRDLQIEAALEHERAHARHRDPLRIWLAQLATDLQWPWPQARERLHQWLSALELARDEEARAAGVDGTDLAEVILASARFTGQANLSMQAALIGAPSTLRERIRRLLDPSQANLAGNRRAYGLLFLLVPGLTLALAGGAIFGERLVRALFWIAA
jgi:hypothetical protein